MSTEATPENLRALATSYAAQRDSVYAAAINHMRAAADRIEELEASLRRMHAELLCIDAEHVPDVLQPGKDPIGCLLCYPADGSWPCSTRMATDDALSALQQAMDGEA